MGMSITPIFGQGVGRRKSAIAKVQIVSGTGRLIINQQSGISYLQENPSSLLAIQNPLEFLDLEQKYDTIVHVEGGGIIGQAAAIQLGLARALCQMEKSYRPLLKQKGYLTRDSREKERRKYGLKKARKAPQYSKR